MLTCREVTEIVTEFLERRMPLWRRLKFHMHIGMCQHCRRYLAQMRLVVQSLGKLPSDPIPKEVEDELLRRFQTWKGPL